MNPFASEYKGFERLSKTKAGKAGRDKLERGYRSPRAEDDNSLEIAACLVEKMEEWQALDFVPSEAFPADGNDTRPIQYGMPLWRDLFNPRQLLGHGTAVEVFRELLDEYESKGALDDVTRAAFVYLHLDGQDDGLQQPDVPLARDSRADGQYV